MRKFLVHAAVWIVFFLMWDRIVYFYISNPLNRLYFSALDVSLIICAFYMVYLYLMPDYLRRKNLWRLIALSALLFISLAALYSWLMSVLLHHLFMPIHFYFAWNYTQMQVNRYLIALVGVLGGCFIKLAADRLAAQRKIDQMEKEKSQAELTYLKAQINPHFLFNSLNSLYTQLELSPNDAKGTLVSIAEMLRYQLYDCAADRIALEKELVYLENYFNLQSLRTDNCITTLIKEGEPGELSIAPLLLIPFVENAFKYVSDDNEQENFIRVAITIKNNELFFNCVNTFNAEKNTGAAGNKGIGLINVKKRLALVYPGRHRLQQQTDAQIYTVNLTLML